MFQEQKNQKNYMAVKTAIRIIKKGVSNDIFNNITDIINFKEI